MMRRMRTGERLYKSRQVYGNVKYETCLSKEGVMWKFQISFYNISYFEIPSSFSNRFR